MAKLIGQQFTATALSRGASGRGVPSRRLVLAFATACDADTQEAMRLWKAARRAREERRRLARTSPEFRDLAVSVRSAMTHPDLIDSFGQLHDAMVEMRIRNGQPSLSELQEAAGRSPDGQKHRLPRSSLSVILRGEAVPSRAHLTAFMEALNASPSTVQRWQRLWDRLDSTTRRPPAGNGTTDRSMVTIKVTDAPPSGEPGGHVPPGDGGAALDFIEGEVLNVLLTKPGIRLGPQPACPPAGLTRAGLPIRTPRQYDLSPRSHLPPRSGVIGYITLLPQETPPGHPGPGTHWTPPADAYGPVRAAEPYAPRGRLGRTVERLIPKRRRPDHTRWPNY
ncbi:XRE family transcriptional regulator [Streptomyces sp. NPDC058425]